MKIVQVPFDCDFIVPLKLRKKRLTRRPLRFQPRDIVDGVLLFGDVENEQRIYEDDFFCPHGNVGDLMQMHVEGNDLFFHEEKIKSKRIERLSAITLEDAMLEGCSSLEEFFALWEKIYLETPYSMVFDPFVFRIGF